MTQLKTSIFTAALFSSEVCAPLISSAMQNLLRACVSIPALMMVVKEHLA